MLKHKLTIYIFLIATAAVVVSTAVGIGIFRERELDAARQSLYQMLSLLDAQEGGTDVDALLGQFTDSVPNLRLTLVSPDGSVLGDTAAATAEDHSNRPEVEQAQAQGVGSDVRRSATTGEITVYVAMRFADGVVGRASQTVASVNALVAQWALAFVAGGVLALVLAFVLAQRLARNAIRPVEEAEVAVRRVDATLQSARSEFTANVTHELKTPLTSIKGFTDMMESGLVKDPEDQKRFLAMISVEVDRLTKLVDDILQITELETVAGALPGEQCSMTQVARDAEQFLRPVAEKAGVTLSVSGGEVEGGISPDRFKEVALNLMENAVKYNKPGGRVSVTLDKEGEQAVFTVSDTGIGIPEESQSRVFERFYRVDKGRSRAAGGTGLGLAIVKHIVALYSGQIQLSSVVGVGTTITVRLPLAQAGG